MGTEKAPVPVTGFIENFSPIPRIAPPPLGNEICGVGVDEVEEGCCAVPDCWEVPCDVLEDSARPTGLDWVPGPSTLLSFLRHASSIILIMEEQLRGKQKEGE